MRFYSPSYNPLEARRSGDDSFPTCSLTHQLASNLKNGDLILKKVMIKQTLSKRRKKCRRRKKGNRKLNAPPHNIDLHCDIESLGLENHFDEDFQSRHTARWAIQSRVKSRQRKRELLRKRKRQLMLSSLSDDEALSGFSDDDETDTASTSVDNEDYSSSKPKMKPKKISPNYFIAIRVSNPRIHDGVKNVQDSIVTHNEELKLALKPLATLHLTLLVVHLEDEEQIQKATQILHQCRRSLEPILQNDTLTLNFAGLGHFDNRVLFVKLCSQKKKKVVAVADIVKKTFAEEGIHSTDSRKFYPHLTVMDLAHKRKLRKQGITKIPVQSYATWAHSKFGKELVTGFHLCSMKEKDKDGFYKCVASVTFKRDNKAQ